MLHEARAPTVTPTPIPSPQGRGEPTEFAARPCVNLIETPRRCITIRYDNLSGMDLATPSLAVAPVWWAYWVSTLGNIMIDER